MGRLESEPLASARRSTVAPHVLRPLLVTLERAGVTRERFFEAAGIDPESLDDAEARWPTTELMRWYEIALDLTSDPALGLHWGDWATRNAFSIVSHLVAHETTLRQAFTALFDFGDLLTDDLGIEMEIKGDHVIVRQVDLGEPTPRVRRLVAELILVCQFRLVRRFSPHGKFYRVNFAHPAPEYAAEYSPLFESMERFDQPFTGLVFDRSLLDATLPYTDKEMRQLLRTLAQQRLQRLRQSMPYAQRVQSVLRKEPVPHRVAMRSAARRLGLSARSLHRRLSEEGLSYTQLANEASATLVKRLLVAERRTIQEVSRALGFESTNSFQRAFKRWTGRTPGRLRSGA